MMAADLLSTSARPPVADRTIYWHEKEDLDVVDGEVLS
jgi:hypothetical protein